MYLSKLILNPLSTFVQRDVANPYQMHRSIMRAFPNELEPGTGRVLWRLELPPRTFQPGQAGFTLLVQSWTEPNWTFRANSRRYTYLLDAPLVREWNPQMQRGQTLSFRFRACPTKRQADNGRRRGLTTLEDQLAWLDRQGKRWGFASQGTVFHAQMLDFKIPRKSSEEQPWWDEEDDRDDGDGGAGAPSTADRRSHRIRLLAVQYEGWLQCRQPGDLLRAISAGIGPGKGLGLGMLSVFMGEAFH